MNKYDSTNEKVHLFLQLHCICVSYNIYNSTCVSERIYTEKMGLTRIALLHVTLLLCRRERKIERG